jgi:FixJ family two-component response regulator
MSDQPIVHVVDDDLSLRKMLAPLMESAGYEARTYESAEAFLQAYEPGTMGCAIVDLRMPEMSGLDLQRELLSREIDLPLVFLSGYATVGEATEAMKTGAVYFLQKPVDPEELLARVREAVQTSRHQLQEQTVGRKAHDRLATLTPREREVLELIIEGRSTREIAASLYRSEKTIETHRAHIMTKLQARNVADMVRMATRVGLNVQSGP